MYIYIYIYIYICKSAVYEYMNIRVQLRRCHVKSQFRRCSTYACTWNSAIKNKC